MLLCHEKIIFDYENVFLLLVTWLLLVTQQAINCSNSAIETAEKRCKICSKLSLKTPELRH